MATITMKELLEAGVHFGHLTRKWNPKMKRYIFGQRNGIHILDLRHTLKEFHRAATFVSDTTAKGGKVLFVGTKRQAQETIRETAQDVNMPYVTERWLGGTLTNHQCIMTRVQRLKNLEKLDSDPKFENLTKKERLLLEKERVKLDRMLSGIRDLLRLPSALFIVDIRKERNCIREAKKLGIPVIAMVDTNCDPDMVDFSIPANDDAVRSIGLFTRRIAEAAREGREVFKAHEEARKEDEAMQEKIKRDHGAVEEDQAPKGRRAARAPSRTTPKARMKKEPDADAPAAKKTGTKAAPKKAASSAS